MKKWLSLALTFALLLSLTACGGTPSADGAPAANSTQANSDAPSDNSGMPVTGMAADGDLGPDTDAGAEPDDPNRIILGSADMLGGDFRFPGWGIVVDVSGADQDIWTLTAGYAVMESDPHGTWHWNDTAVKEHSLVENPDGTATLTVEINHDLTYSDGTPITVKDYLARLLVFSSPVAVAAEAPGLEGQRLAGFAGFHAYTGDNDGQTAEAVTADGAEGVTADGVTAGKVFSGVRMLDDYTYALTISSDYYPDYFADVRACLQPDLPALWLGEGVDILDDGAGCYLSDAFYAKNGDSFAAARTIQKNVYDKTDFPFSGPYVIADWDNDVRQATLKINPAYKGNFEGQKPSIETLVYVHLDDYEPFLESRKKDLLLQRLQSGGVDVLRMWSGLERIQQVLALVDDEHLTAGCYQRPGCGKLDFACDFGPTILAPPCSLRCARRWRILSTARRFAKAISATTARPSTVLTRPTRPCGRP